MHAADTALASLPATAGTPATVATAGNAEGSAYAAPAGEPAASNSLAGVLLAGADLETDAALLGGVAREAARQVGFLCRVQGLTWGSHFTEHFATA